MNQPLSLIFLGPPGSGKGTQAQGLADDFQIPHISTGEILREAVAKQTPLGQKAKNYMDKGELVPDNLLLALIEGRLAQPDAAKGWILDGFPRNTSQAEFLENLLAQLGQSSVHVISLEVPDEAIVTRLLARGRTDDSEHTIRRRLEVYREQTAPVTDYYRQRGKLAVIDGDRPPNAVSQSLKELIAS
jgi:adenylate kinase